MVHGENRIPFWIDRRLTALQDPNIMPSSRLDCPLSLKTPNMGNTGLQAARFFRHQVRFDDTGTSSPLRQGLQ